MKLNKTQRRLLSELKPTYGGQSIKPKLSTFSSSSFTADEEKKYGECGIVPKTLRSDVTYLVEKGLIKSEGLDGELSITSRGIDLLNESSWFVASMKKGVQNAIEKWTTHVLSFLAGMAVLKLLELLR